MVSGIQLGCVADDLTGATDVAGALVAAGLRTVQLVGVPEGMPSGVAAAADAVVVALKTRTIPAADAVRQSVAAARWLLDASTRRLYFKYCSTFDSTPAGNIGPVADALADECDSRITVACPAYPTNGRTVYRGHLFVGDVPLHESGMRHHPLTPMTDSNLVRVLQAQTPRDVGLVRFEAAATGAAGIERELERLRALGVRLAIVDALSDEHLDHLAVAVLATPLVTGGTGLAAAIGRALALGHPPAALDPPAGLTAVISGSCSEATRRQVAHFSARHPVVSLDPVALADGFDPWPAIEAVARAALGDGPVLVSSTAAPVAVAAAQTELGAARASEVVEAALARVAANLVELGVRRLVVAGGETAGAVVEALGVRALRIGADIDPGVPWTTTLDREGPALALALKSGNFGRDDLFTRAFDVLAGAGR